MAHAHLALLSSSFKQIMFLPSLSYWIESTMRGIGGGVGRGGGERGLATGCL